MTASLPPERAPRLLGDFLRAQRDRLTPGEVGLPAGQRRRAPGLRREEVAALCGISPTWYAWIEQGRATAVSVETLVALAQGLRLSPAERAYLFEVGARADPARRPPREAPPHGLQPLVQAVRTPAYVLDHHWEAVAWNRPAAALFADWLGARAGRSGPHNLLRYVFLHPQAPAFIEGWAERAGRLVAEFRADTATWRDDPVQRSLVDALRAGSSVFAAAWRSQQVLAREGGLRRFNHPQRGRCDFQQHTLRMAQQAGLKLIVLVPLAEAPAGEGAARPGA
ncbi:MAG: helix-turn-helix transcriptional regulator [Burkholderiales bacterium]